MKIMIVAFTLLVSVVSGCGSAPVHGCNPSNTAAAPTDGLVTAFSIRGGGVQSEVGIGPAEAAPKFTTDGALHITVNAPTTSAAQVLLVDLPLQQCIDASAFTGLQFSISGSISGCTFAQATQDSAHLRYDWMAIGPGTHGTGESGAHPNHTVLTPDQITAAPQTLKMPFAAQTGGVPATATDKSMLTWLDWVFLVDPYKAGGPSACKADLTITDVTFY